VLTGEHSVGIAHIVNAGKGFPTLHRCAELGRLRVHHGQLRVSDLLQPQGSAGSRVAAST
jgi:hypothetical protein